MRSWLYCVCNWAATRQQVAVTNEPLVTLEPSLERLPYHCYRKPVIFSASLFNWSSVGVSQALCPPWFLNGVRDVT